MKYFNLAIVFSVILLAVVHRPAMAAPGSSAAAVKPAIGGYSPVSYFTENKAERGSPEFSAEHDGRVYFFTSQEQVELFTANPKKYRPRYHLCPYSLALGMVLPLDPTNFKIIGDNLLLFHLSEEKDALKEWEVSKMSKEELIRRADANLIEINF